MKNAESVLSEVTKGSDERKLFEAWASANHFDVGHKSAKGAYIGMATGPAWEAWQARASLGAAQVPDNWNEAIEAAAKRIENGSFLHDKSPAKLFANELAPVIRTMKRSEPTAGAAQVPETWRCFHCDEVFTTPEAAIEHFGRTERQSPACQIDIAEYRRMEENHRRNCEEDTDLHRQIYNIQGDHAQALLREEERGYARGLKDAKKHPEELGLQAIPTEGAAVEPSQPAPVLPTADDLGRSVAVWTGGVYEHFRGDNGKPEPWLKVSIERLGYGIEAILKDILTSAPTTLQPGDQTK